MLAGGTGTRYHRRWRRVRIVSFRLFAWFGAPSHWSSNGPTLSTRVYFCHRDPAHAACLPRRLSAGCAIPSAASRNRRPKHPSPQPPWSGWDRREAGRQTNCRRWETRETRCSSPTDRVFGIVDSPGKTRPRPTNRLDIPVKLKLPKPIALKSRGLVAIVPPLRLAPYKVLPLGSLLGSNGDGFDPEETRLQLGLLHRLEAMPGCRRVVRGRGWLPDQRRGLDVRFAIWLPVYSALDKPRSLWDLVDIITEISGGQ